MSAPVTNKIGVLIVDDSVVIRKFITEVIKETSDMEVVGTAPTGEVAITKVENLNPDVVTLDVEMPGMGGLEALKEIRKISPRLPIIMYSALTKAGASVTIEALIRGANDYAPKPTTEVGSDSAREHIKKTLLPRIRIFAGNNVGTANVTKRLRGSDKGLRLSKALDGRKTKAEILVVGVSTGGPKALAKLFKDFPQNLSVPVLVVQHMPALFTQQLATRLDGLSKLHVGEAVDGVELRAGEAWIARGDFHLSCERVGKSVVLKTSKSARVSGCRPSVDVLFKSAAKVYGKAAVATIMTGMGHDGFNGAKAIKRAGGYVVAQDEASSVVWGMPGAVVRGGLANEIIPLNRMASDLASMVNTRKK